MLTSDNHAYLKQLWGNFHNRIQKLDKNGTLSYLSNNKENNKRDRSVPVIDKDSDNELELVQQNTKWMHTYQFGASNFEVCAPHIEPEASN